MPTIPSLLSTRIRLILTVLALALATIGGAHPSNVANANLKVATDGSFTLRLHFDVLAYAVDQTPMSVADGPMNAILDSSDAAIEAKLREIETRLRTSIVSGTTLRTVGFPTLADVVAARDRESIRRLPVLGSATFTGKLPPGVRTISFRFPASLDTVVLTTEFPYQEPISEPVPAGETSRALPIPTDAQVAASARAMGVAPPNRSKPVAKSPVKAAGTSGPTKSSVATKLGPAPKPPVPPFSPKTSPSPPSAEREPTVTSQPAASTTKPEASSNNPSTNEANVKEKEKKDGPPPAPEAANIATVAAPTEVPLATSNPLADLPRYVRLGFLHILPEGIDHILFVLGLVLVAVRTKDLLTQVSAFTVAHSLTLGLALFGVVRLPERIVEPIIALSIAFVAIENIWAKKVGPWRIGAVFVFGLIHGLGFAGALQDLGLARRDLLPALVGFNVGVELGQLSVVAMALGVIGHFRGHENYRKYVVVPASLAIAAVAIVWTIQRVLPG